MAENQSTLGPTVPVEEAADQVLIAVERLAMLHYHYANTLIEELAACRRERRSHSVRLC